MTKLPAWEPPVSPNFDDLKEKASLAWHRDQPKLIAFDTETTGLEYFDLPFCVTIAWHGKEGIEGHYIELRTQDDADFVRMMMWYATTWVGHNTKFDLHKLVLGCMFDYSEFNAALIEDTEALAHLDDEHRLKGLKGLAVSVLGIEDFVDVEVKSGPRKGQINHVPKEKHELELAKKWAKKKYGIKSVKDIGYDLLPRGVIVPYAIKDAVFTFMLYDVLKPRIEAYPDSLVRCYEQELQDTIVFLDIEAKGMGVNEPYVNKQIKVYTNRIIDKELDIEQIVGLPVGKGAEEFNPNSNPQIAEYFTKQGFQRESYDEENMLTIDHPLAEKLLELRGDQKVLNTYFRPLKKGTVNGVFHPSIRQHGTVTGRPSSGGAKAD